MKYFRQIIKKQGKVTNITIQLQQWYQINKRDLPWRNTKNPYYIWLSEVILQQTQVVQGTSYYYKFIETYPSVDHLAACSQEEVLKNWQGLGYYSRARNLHFAAQQVVSEYKGEFPSTYSEILKLKGVGEYTAAAVASFAYGEVKAVVDGNVYRVLSRLFTIDTPINTGKGKKEFAIVAQGIIDQFNPAIHNQAMMELGALVCRPQNPKCEICPLSRNCEAFRMKSTAKYPVKENKVRIRKRFFNYLIFTDGRKLLINRRAGKGIWQGLYDFPLLESEQPISSIETFEKKVIDNIIFDCEMKHVLTHQHLHVKFWIAEKQDLQGFSNYECIRISNIEDYPLPQLLVRYIKESNFFRR